MILLSIWNLEPFGSRFRLEMDFDSFRTTIDRTTDTDNENHSQLFIIYTLSIF